MVFISKIWKKVTTVESRLFQVSRSPPRPTISLSRDALRSVWRKWEEWGRGAFSWYGNWGSGGKLSRLEINKTLSFRDTWNNRDLNVVNIAHVSPIFEYNFGMLKKIKTWGNLHKIIQNCFFLRTHKNSYGLILNTST